MDAEAYLTGRFGTLDQPEHCRADFLAFRIQYLADLLTAYRRDPGNFPRENAAWPIMERLCLTPRDLEASLAHCRAMLINKNCGSVGA